MQYEESFGAGSGDTDHDTDTTPNKQGPVEHGKIQNSRCGRQSHLSEKAKREEWPSKKSSTGEQPNTDGEGRVESGGGGRGGAEAAESGSTARGERSPGK